MIVPALRGMGGGNLFYRCGKSQDGAREDFAVGRKSKTPPSRKECGKVGALSFLFSASVCLASDRLRPVRCGLAVQLGQLVQGLQAFVHIEQREGVEGEVEPETEAEEDQAIQGVENHRDQEGPLLAFASKFPEE